MVFWKSSPSFSYHSSVMSAISCFSVTNEKLPVSQEISSPGKVIAEKNFLEYPGMYNVWMSYKYRVCTKWRGGDMYFYSYYSHLMVTWRECVPLSVICCMFAPL